MSSPVSQLQWENGLDYIYVATGSSVKTFNLSITLLHCKDHLYYHGILYIAIPKHTLHCFYYLGSSNPFGGVC